MSPEPGWYPDPGGKPDAYRYWDGTSWTERLSSDPAGSSRGTKGLVSAPGSTRTGGDRKRRSWAWVGFVIVGVVVIALIALLLRAWSGAGSKPDQPANPTGQICPVPDQANASQDPHPADGYVWGGKLGFPQQGSPWEAPILDDRVPFGRDTRVQQYTTEAAYQPGRAWVASLLVAQLARGDGYENPGAAIATVATCIVGAFYGDNEVHRTDTRAENLKVDGKTARLLEMHLTFDIQGLKAKGEVALIVIVQTAPDDMSIYYASIPDNSPPEFMPLARTLVKQLKVSP